MPGSRHYAPPGRRGRSTAEVDIDMIVEAAAVEGQLASGVSRTVVASRSLLGARGVIALATPKVDGEPSLKKAKAPAWAHHENVFLKAALGVLSEEEIAEALGRSAIGVHIHWSRDLRLPAPSKNPSIMTASQIANGLGVDAKSVALLIKREILPGYLLPGNDVTRVVDRMALLRFLVNPMNWVYFKPERVGLRPPKHRGGKVYDAEFWAYARRLVLKKRKMWKDKWLRIGEVARLHGVSDRTVNQAIRRGRVKALDWGNWWILRSVATGPSVNFLTAPGKGHKCVDLLCVSPGAEAFIIIARAIGLMYQEIGALMGWKEKRVDYVFKRLRREGRIPRIIKEHGLKVFYDKKSGEVFADWRMYRHRFPRLAKFMKLARRGKRNRAESKCFALVKRKAARFNELRKRYLLR